MLAELISHARCRALFIIIFLPQVTIVPVPTLGVNGGGVDELNMVELRHITLMDIF